MIFGMASTGRAVLNPSEYQNGTRPEILLALLEKPGVGVSIVGGKFCTTESVDASPEILIDANRTSGHGVAPKR